MTRKLIDAGATTALTEPPPEADGVAAGAADADAAVAGAVAAAAAGVTAATLRARLSL